MNDSTERRHSEAWCASQTLLRGFVLQQLGSSILTLQRIPNPYVPVVIRTLELAVREIAISGDKEKKTRTAVVPCKNTV